MNVLFVTFGSILVLFMLGVFLFGLSACMMSSKISQEEESNTCKKEHVKHEDESRRS